MKKITYSLLTLVVTAMGFASCENVPAPYDYPEDNKGGKTEVPGTYINETFTTGFGKFEVVTQAGKAWKPDFNTAKASGYDNKTKTNTPSESFLVSPEINLSKSTGAYLQFEYIFQYANNDGEDKVLITSDYTGDPKSTKWEDITGTLTQGKPKDWKTFYTFSQNIPASYIGKDKVRIAFYYSASAKGSRTWEVKSVLVKEGETSEKPDTPAGEETKVIKPVNGTYIQESFASAFGVFSPKTVKGTPWIINHNTAKATGYDHTSKTTTPSEAYIVSKPMDMSTSKDASISFDYILRYATFKGKAQEGVVNKVLVTDNYSGDPTTTKWTDITGKLTEGTDWTTYSSYAANLPNEIVGKKNVVIALKFACGAKSATWEVKNLKVKEGKISQQDPTPDNPTITPDAGESITIEAASMKFKDKEAATSFTHSDGTVITFDKGEGTDQPIYNGPRYTAVRLYAKNTMTIKAKKKITAIHIKTTDKYKEKLYNGNDEAYVLNGTSKVTIKKVNDTNVQFAPLNNSTIKLVNDFSTNNGGTQLRISSMTITFAKE